MTGEPPREGGDLDLHPASLSHVRALRRLLAAVAVFAVAACVIAAVALVQEDPVPQRSDAALGLTSRIGELERKLEGRLDDIEKQLEGAPTADDLEKLAEDVSQARSDTRDAVRAARDLNENVGTLDERVAGLEERVQRLESAGDDDQP
ncbi:MAG TPA: DUF2730 family protein [Thermoleophilaceae bacterium]|nr:DUF2730 family protein [Thermoleophilaceae bacterium]